LRVRGVDSASVYIPSSCYSLSLSTVVSATFVRWITLHASERAATRYCYLSGQECSSGGINSSRKLQACQCQRDMHPVLQTLACIRWCDSIHVAIEVVSLISSTCTSEVRLSFHQRRMNDRTAPDEGVKIAPPREIWTIESRSGGNWRKSRVMGKRDSETTPSPSRGGMIGGRYMYLCMYTCRQQVSGGGGGQNCERWE